MLPRGDPEPRGEQLHQGAHDRRPQQQPQQLVPRRRAGLQVALQVPRVEERDAHEEPGPREPPQLAPREGRAHGVAAAAAAVLRVGVRDGDGDLVVGVVRALVVLVVGGGGGGGGAAPHGEEALGEVARRHGGGSAATARWASEWEEMDGSGLRREVRMGSCALWTLGVVVFLR